MKKPKQERARDTFLKWAKSGLQEDMFELSFSDNIFVAIRIPKAFHFTYKYKKE